jgi:hypothetical protein
VSVFSLYTAKGHLISPAHSSIARIAMGLPGTLSTSEEYMLTNHTLCSNINILYTKSNTDSYKLQQSTCAENLEQRDK